MGSLTDEQIVIKNKLEKPEGYIYFDKEEYDSDQELIKRYNEIVGLKNELLENEKALKEKYPEFNSFIGVMEIQNSLEEHAMVIQERPELLRAHQKWVREQQQEADEKNRNSSDIGRVCRWVGGVAEEFLTTLGQGVFLDFPRLVDGFIRNEYNAIDLRSDEMHETLSQGFHRIFADDHFNEKGAGGFSQYVVDMGDGHKIMVDRDGNPLETYFEDEEGYIKQSFFNFDYSYYNKYKFLSGPFTSMIFKFISQQKNKIKILLGNFKTTVSEKEYLFRPV